jgi:hypothetical protein
MTYHLLLGLLKAGLSPIRALSRSCIYTALLMAKLGPTPNRVIKFPAFRSLHQVDVSFEESMMLVKTLMVRIPNSMVCAFKVFQTHWTKPVNHRTKDIAMLSSNEPKDSKNSPVMVRCFSERRTRDTKGDSLPANSEA